ncbi:MAG: hypothetical protein ACTHL8_06845 [Burkholderiaceae bacterium]
MPSTDDAARRVPSPVSHRLRRVAAWLGLCSLAACHTTPPVAGSHAAAAPPAPSGHAAAGSSQQRPATSMDEYRLRAAHRLVAANPKITYLEPAPDPLLAIPVIEVEVNADGSVRHMTVMRVPTQAQDTVRIALAAIERAAPFGDATHCPKPWKFTEVFLFDDDRRFKPRSLD